MPSIYQLKPRFQNVLRPGVQWLYQRGVTANQVTLSAALLSLVLGAVLALCPEYPHLFALIPLWMLLRMALNAMDGMLAREFGQQSPLGGYLNELCDVIADSALFLPFALLPGVSAVLVVVVTLLALVVEYAGVMGPLVGAGRRYDGPMGKSDRAFVFGVLGLGVATAWLPAFGLNLILGLTGLLLVWTLVNRVNAGLADLGR